MNAPFRVSEREGLGGTLLSRTLSGASFGFVGGAVGFAVVSWVFWTFGYASSHHAWASSAGAFFATSCAFPSATAGAAVAARQTVVDSNCVFDASTRVWRSLVADSTEMAMTEVALNSTARAFVEDVVKGAGVYGGPVRFVASFVFPQLDAALGRIDEQLRGRRGKSRAARTSRRNTFLASKASRRIEPLVGAAFEGVVLRTLDDFAFLAFSLAVAAFLGAQAFVLLIDYAIPAF